MDSGVFPEMRNPADSLMDFGQIQSVVQWPMQWELLIKSYNIDFTLLDLLDD